MERITDPDIKKFGKTGVPAFDHLIKDSCVNCGAPLKGRTKRYVERGNWCAKCMETIGKNLATRRRTNY